MTLFDSNQGAQVSKQIEEVVERPRVGRIIQVFEHVRDSDYSNFELDIELLDERDKQLRSVPWQAPVNGEVNVPKVGDKVIVEYRSGAKKTAIARHAVYTNEHRPPKATAGTWRKRVPADVPDDESISSPAGRGDLYVETGTEYDTNPASAEFVREDAVPQSSYVRLGKKLDDLDNTIDGSSLPMFFELVDNPADDEAHVTIELNKVDGADSSATWGVKFDLKTGEFKILDANGYGIVSDGAGNFDWHYETIDHLQGSTTTL